MKKIVLSILLFVFFSFFFPVQSFAQTQIIAKEQPLIQGMYFPNEMKLPDPTITSQTIYSALLNSHAVDSYYFIPQHTADISLETLVPVRASNENFGPAWELIGPNVHPQPMMIEFSIPTNSNDIGHDYYPPVGKRNIVYDLVSLEPLYQGNKQTMHVLSGQMYYINIYDPFHYTGDYVLKLSNTQDHAFSPTFATLQIIALNQVSIQPIPWVSFFGLFLGILGLIISIGFLLSGLFFQKFYSLIPKGQKYLFFAQIISVISFSTGILLLYQQAWASLMCLCQLFVAMVLLVLSAFDFLNGEKRHVIFSVLSMILWLLLLLSFVWYMLVLR